ncbi:hypothetical protein [Paenalcaligenes suwonensis]|uniref:hypothetical protein n=1 Tax=Paenalcaligenes suwonensis TaxID=1202713 RepID=UPI00140882E9|nr:hypothetical protein [Paenalcaligenes suwonensis]NHC63067.1 hypothetical protein [Paenalcaligenes suwonensis]
MDNQHKHLKGDLDLSQEEIDMINEGRELSAQADAWIEKLREHKMLANTPASIPAKAYLRKGFDLAIIGISLGRNP